MRRGVVMANKGTQFNAYGFLGYEVVIDRVAETNVLFGIADEKETLLAWYAYRAKVSDRVQPKFDQMHVDNSKRKPDLDSDFGTAYTLSGGGYYSFGQFNVSQLVPRGQLTAIAELMLSDQKQGGVTTDCMLSVPSVRPGGLVLAFRLVTKRKRRTPDAKKPGTIILMAIHPFNRSALVDGAHPADLQNAGGYRK